MEITIDDVSPLITYSANWVDDHAAGTAYPDNRTAYYYEETFHATLKVNAWASFSFNGSAIRLYGKLGTNHGVYSVQLDGQPATWYPGGADHDEFQQCIYVADGLSTAAEHTIVLSNDGGSNCYTGTQNGTSCWVDLDYISWTAPVPSQGDIATYVIDDQSSAFTYSPASVWNVNTTDVGTVTNTAHQGAYVDLAFSGHSIDVRGVIGPVHGNYSVSLDGGPARLYSAYRWNTVFDASLYIATGLEDGPHTLRITNEMLASGKSTFDLGRAVVNTSSTSTTVQSVAGVSTAGKSAPTTMSAISSIQSTRSPATVTADSPNGANDSAAHPTSQSFVSTTAGRVTVSCSVIAGALVAILLGLIFLRCRKKRQQTDPWDRNGGQYDWNPRSSRFLSSFSTSRSAERWHPTVYPYDIGRKSDGTDDSSPPVSLSRRLSIVSAPSAPQSPRTALGLPYLQGNPTVPSEVGSTTPSSITYPIQSRAMPYMSPSLQRFLAASASSSQSPSSAAPSSFHGGHHSATRSPTAEGSRYSRATTRLAYDETAPSSIGLSPTMESAVLSTWEALPPPTRPGGPVPPPRLARSNTRASRGPGSAPVSPI